MHVMSKPRGLRTRGARVEAISGDAATRCNSGVIALTPVGRERSVSHLSVLALGMCARREDDEKTPVSSCALCCKRTDSERCM